MILLAVGAILRVALSLAYSPAYLSYPDTWGYAKAAAGPLFMDDWIRPAGYPAILAAFHAVWGNLEFAIALQHVLGLATAVLAYATMLRVGAARWVALLSAGVILLTVDSLYFEHAVLSEGPFTFLFVAAVYATVRALEPPGSPAWAAGTGALIAAAILVRGVALFAVPVMVVVVAIGSDIGWRRRLAGAGALAATCLVLLIGYAALQESQNGYFGLTEGNGWAMYARAAPFADCTRFLPPEETRALCEPTDPSQRAGPDFYAWGNGSIGRQLFGGPPQHADVVGSFGRSAILGQTKTYLSTVATEIWRYVVPSAGPERHGNGATPDELSIGLRNLGAEKHNMTTIEPLYGDLEIETAGLVSTFEDAQRVVRVHGPLVLLAVLLAAAALPFAAAPQRIGLLLLGGVGLVPVVMATAAVVYNWRYMVPALPLLVGAGAMGAEVLAARVRSRRAAPERDAALA